MVCKAAITAVILFLLHSIYADSTYTNLVRFKTAFTFSHYICGRASDLTCLQFIEADHRGNKNHVGPLQRALVLDAKKKRKRSSTSKHESFIDDDRDKILSDLIAKDDGKRVRSSSVSSSELTSGEPARTLSGGPSLIFEMARRMLVWDDELYQGLNDASPDGDKGKLLSTALSGNANPSINAPRWRPSPLLQRSISNVNPAFRTSSPIMTSAGYAGILRRNSRKKVKPSMWRHTLRVYDKMADLEKITIDGRSDSKKKAIRRRSVHHEAALVAASKLGAWEQAIKIYRDVEDMPISSNRKASMAVVGVGDGNTNSSDSDALVSKNLRRISGVTDNMILSVISACVKGSYVKRTTNMISFPAINTTNATSVGNNSNNFASCSSQRTVRTLTIEERRRPLDAAREILLSIEEKHDIPLVARHINPLAAGYIRLGLRMDATTLINRLKDRKIPPLQTYKIDKANEISETQYRSEQTFNEDEDEYLESEEEQFESGYEETQLNIHQVKAKDRGSYSLLVQGAVIDEDWSCAVEELKRMTEVGLYPNSRNLNAWAEAVEPSCRPSKNSIHNLTQGRKGRKKRERLWLDNWQR